MPLSLDGNINLRAADAAASPFDITLSGVLSGTGGFTKTENGTLILSGANTYAGTTSINAGTLRVDGSLSSTGGAVSVNGGTLSGNGAVNRAVTLNSGGTVAPGDTSSATLSGNSLIWSSGGKLAFDLGSASDSLVLSGALTKSGGSLARGGGSKLVSDLLVSSDVLTKGGSRSLSQRLVDTYEFVFTPRAGFTVGATYTLATFGSTNFTAADFSYSGLPPGITGFFQVNAGSLQFTIAAPTAANVSISGTIKDQFGRGVSRAIVEIMSQNGERKSATTNNFGNYIFSDIPSGETYIFRISNKSRESVTQIVTVYDSISDLDFVISSD